MCGSGDILADRHTDIHTHYNTSQPLPRVSKYKDNVINIVTFIV